MFLHRVGNETSFVLDTLVTSHPPPNCHNYIGHNYLPGEAGGEGLCMLAEDEETYPRDELHAECRHPHRFDEPINNLLVYRPSPDTMPPDSAYRRRSTSDRQDPKGRRSEARRRSDRNLPTETFQPYRGTRRTRLPRHVCTQSLGMSAHSL